MKILLDECVTRKAKQLLTEFEVFTVTEMGFAGFKNGKMLAAAETAGFNILLTIEKNIVYQQNISKFQLSVVVLNVVKSNIKYVEKLIPEFKNRIEEFEKGKSYLIESPKA